MTPTNLKNKKTAEVAEAFIGAAQALEAEAKRLREQARTIRRDGLWQYDTAIDPLTHQREHKACSVKAAALKALVELGYATADDYLVCGNYR